jgi:hypothetical protein
MSKEAYLDEAYITIKIAHMTEECHHSLSAASYGPHITPESGKSSTS